MLKKNKTSLKNKSLFKYNYHLLSIIIIFIIVALITTLIPNTTLGIVLFWLLPIFALILSIYFFTKEKNYLQSLSITFLSGILIILIPVILSSLESNILDGEEGVTLWLSRMLGLWAFVMSIIINGILSLINKH